MQKPLSAIDMQTLIMQNPRYTQHPQTAPAAPLAATPVPQPPQINIYNNDNKGSWLGFIFKVALVLAALGAIRKWAPKAKDFDLKASCDTFLKKCAWLPLQIGDWVVKGCETVAKWFRK